MKEQFKLTKNNTRFKGEKLNYKQEPMGSCSKSVAKEILKPLVLAPGVLESWSPD